jgi:hypothetical protein
VAPAGLCAADGGLEVLIYNPEAGLDATICFLAHPSCPKPDEPEPVGLRYISAMEACDCYRPWHDKASGKMFVRTDSGKCLHDYFFSWTPTSA